MEKTTDIGTGVYKYITQNIMFKTSHSKKEKWERREGCTDTVLIHTQRSLKTQMDVHRREQMNKGGRILKNKYVSERPFYIETRREKQSNDKKNMVKEII